MEATSTLIDALLATGTVAILFCTAIWCLYRVVVWARRQSKRAYVIGAALAPFIALGMVVDPEMRIVQQAKQLKKREEDEPGDPPASESESIVRTAAEIAAKNHESLPRKDAVAITPPKPTRPASVWLIAIGLGLMATLAALVLTWLLFAAPSVLTPERELYFDVRVSSFGAIPIAIAVFLYMFRLKRRAVLA